MIDTFHLCPYCDYKSKRKTDVLRHLVSSKHFYIEEQNVCTEIKEELPVSNKQCSKCFKSFTRLQNLNRHIKTCKGNKETYLTCKYCDKKFTRVLYKKIHIATCKDKNVKQIIPNVLNFQQLIDNKEGESVFDLRYIRFKSLDYYCYLSDDWIITTLSYRARRTFYIATTMARLILKCISNRFIQKTNKKSKYSKVHIGNNKWMLMSDSYIYPIFFKCMRNSILFYLKSINFNYNDDKYEKFLRALEQLINPFLVKEQKVRRRYCKIQTAVKTNISLMIYKMSKNLFKFKTV